MLHKIQLYYCLPWAKPDLRKSQRLVLHGGLISTKQALLMNPGVIRAYSAIRVSRKSGCSAAECLVL